MTTLAAERERDGTGLQEPAAVISVRLPLPAAIIPLGQLDCLRNIVADVIEEKLTRVIQTSDTHKTACLS
jgi:hypothetical protein